MTTGNGDTRKHILKSIDALVFPDCFDEESKSYLRQRFRDDPSMLDGVVDIPETYEFIMAVPNVARETKEQVIAGLQHYCGDEGTAYASMVGLYLIELSDVIEDELGFRTIFSAINRLRVDSVGLE